MDLYSTQKLIHENRRVVIPAQPPASSQRSPWKTAEERAREREQLRELKREGVLLAAALYFNARVFHNTTLVEIAKRLNVTKPTVYYYVTNKDEILTETFRAGCGALAEAADEVDGSDLVGLDKLAEFMRRYAELMTTDFVKNVALLEDTCLGPKMRAEVREIKSAIDRRFRTFVEEGIRLGAIADCDSKMAAFTIAGALNGIARWYQPEGPLNPQEVAEITVNTLVAGLRAR
jgi:AcrR family transcriptional regulator